MAKSNINSESNSLQKSPKNSFDWEAFRDGPHLFDHYHSFDPGEVEYEWDMLGQDTILLQLLTLPEVIRYAMLKSAKEMSNEQATSK